MSAKPRQKSAGIKPKKPRVATEAAGEKMRISEMRYRRLFMAAQDGILLMDPLTRKITDANPSITQFLGYSKDHLIGKELFEIGLVRDETASRSMFRKLRKEHEVRYENLPLKSRQGKHLNVEVVANLYKEDGHPVIQCNIRDITDRKNVEELLLRNELLLSSLVEQAPLGVFVVDAQFRIVQVNERALPIFGKINSLVGKDISVVLQRLWPKPDANSFMRRLRQTLKTGKTHVATEFETKRKGATRVVIYDWQVQRITLPMGETGVVAYFNDITRQKRAEEASRRLDVLAASNLKLEKEIFRREKVESSLKQSQEELSLMLAESRCMQEQMRSLSRECMRSHEDERKRISRELHDVVAQTLTGINLRLTNLKNASTRGPANLERHINKTQKLVGRAVKIVHKFALQLRPAILDDLGIIPALETHMKSFHAQTGIQPRLTAVTTVEKLSTTHRTVLYRVAQEALSNVAQHAKASQVEVHISQLKQVTRMEIRDDGQSFQKAPQRRKKSKSKSKSRLGLVGMRERVEMVGGTFSVESTAGKGTTVRVDIPLPKVAKTTKRKRAKTR